jgi:hypothetical protein
MLYVPLSILEPTPCCTVVFDNNGDDVWDEAYFFG